MNNKSLTYYIIVNLPNTKAFLYLAFLSMFAFSCSTTKKTTDQAEKFAALYNPSEFSLNADYKIHHLSDDLTALYIRVFPGELLFNQANKDNEYRAVVEIDYILYELNDEEEIIFKADSAVITLRLLADDQKHTAYFASKVMKIPPGKQYLLRLEAKDTQRGTVGLKHLFVDKRNAYSAQNFSVISPRTTYPKFLNYFAVNELFRLHYRDLGVDTVYIDMFTTETPTPRPAVTTDSQSSFSRVPDSTIVIPFSDTMFFTLPKEGMYHIRVDSNRREGIALHNFGEDYPQVKTSKALLGPLFYIATATEYGNLRRNSNLKLAIDDFWLQRANSMERSRELIRIYYNRVLYSNLYFTADREGWKTDRGMIFILFGPPDRMQDTGAEQRWYYISRRQGKVIEFVFERKQNRFTNQDLVWRKTYESMQYLSSAVSSWRSGKVFSFNR